MSPQTDALGFRVVQVDPGIAVMAIAWRPDLVGDPETGVIAGGVLTTLLDHACGLAVFSLLASDGRPGGLATLDLRIDYMRGARPGAEIRARAHCYRLASQIAFVRAAAFEDEEGDPIATAQAAFALAVDPSPPGGAP